jgi:hypothetical protein
MANYQSDSKSSREFLSTAEMLHEALSKFSTDVLEGKFMACHIDFKAHTLTARPTCNEFEP